MMQLICAPHVGLDLLGSFDGDDLLPLTLNGLDMLGICDGG